MRRIVALLVVATLTSLGAAATGAQAAAPTREWVSIDETFPWDGCGFAVERHDAGRLHLVTWFDESGARTRQVVLGPGFKITYTNPVTGASVTAANPFAVHKQFNADGSATISFTGLFFAINGGGTNYVDAGRDLIVFSDGSVELLATAGPSADLCEALAATIGP